MAGWRLGCLGGDTAVPDQLADVNGQLSRAIRSVTGRYIDVGQPPKGHPELMQDDDVHPTAAGQATLAAAIHRACAASTNLGPESPPRRVTFGESEMR